jgi:hypothetical protein
VSDTALALGGVVLGAALTQIGNTAWYLKRKSDDKKAAVKKADEDNNADMLARISQLHDQCTFAKSWLRDLPHWREDLDNNSQRVYEIKSEAARRKQNCYEAWDRAKSGKQPLSAVITAIDELHDAAKKALAAVQSGETLTPSVDDLRNALERFRQTVGLELEMKL